MCVRKRCSFNKLHTTENQWRRDSHEAAAQKWNRSAPPRDRWHLIFLSASPELLEGKKKTQNRLHAATWRSSKLKQTKHSFTFINTKLKERGEDGSTHKAALLFIAETMLQKFIVKRLLLDLATCLLNVYL